MTFLSTAVFTQVNKCDIGLMWIAAGQLLNLINMFRMLKSWWRHQMETFFALLAICAGNSPVPDEFPTQRPVTRSFYVFFDLRSNKRLSKQWRGWWFETQSCPLWRHRNDCIRILASWNHHLTFANSYFRFITVRWVPHINQNLIESIIWQIEPNLVHPYL